MHNLPDTSATALGALLCFVWGAFLLGWLVHRSRIVSDTVQWFRKSSTPRRIAAVLIVAGLVAFGGSKGGGGDSGDGDQQDNLSRPPLLLQRVELPAAPSITPVSVYTNDVAFRAESTNAVEVAVFRRIGGTELGEWLDADAPFFSIGTNPVSRCYVSASGSISFESMRRPPVGSPLPDGTGLPALCPLRAPLGMVPEANWGIANAQSRFWHDALPGGGRVLTWEDALVDRLPGRRVSLQVELQPSGDSVFRYDFHDALDPPATNFTIGAQMGTNGVNALSILGTNVLAATVWNVEGMPVTNGVSIANLLCTNGVLRTPASFEIRWRNTTGLDPNANTDEDGLTDWSETFLWGTDPNYADTDGDGIADNVELMMGMNPRNPDTDGDGMADGWDAEPLTAADSPAFGQSAAWLTAAGVHEYTNALDWAQGVVNEDSDATYLVGISVSGATEEHPAGIFGEGFPSAVIVEDAILWYPLPVAKDVVFQIFGEGLNAEILDSPPQRLLRARGSGLVRDALNFDRFRIWFIMYKPPKIEINDITPNDQTDWMVFEAETVPTEAAIVAAAPYPLHIDWSWSVSPEDVDFTCNGNRLNLWWKSGAESEYADITAIWADGYHAPVTNTVRIARPSGGFVGPTEPLRIRLINIRSQKDGHSPNPPPFLGETEYTFNPSQTNPDKHFVVFYKDVINEDFSVQPYSIELRAELNREPMSGEAVNISWTKISGPDSGTFSSTTNRYTTYDTPAVGGVYRFGVTLNDRPRSECIVVLPLAGGEITNRVLLDLARADDFAARVIAKYPNQDDRNSRKNGLKWFVNYGAGDFWGRPDNQSSPTVWYYNQVSDSNYFGAVATLGGKCVRLAKVSNFIDAYACQKIGVLAINQFLAQLIGTWNNISGTTSWGCGMDYANGTKTLVECAELIAESCWNEGDEKVQRLWPNLAPADNFVEQNLFFDPNTQFSAPGFLLMIDP